MLLYLFKIADLFVAGLIKSEVKYQNKEFIAFLKEEEKYYSKNHNIKLTGGIQGKWIEVQLPDRAED